ncbi:MAG TPA: SDR family oxidoreductase, partial [Proteobacteria bacterium]|nr:SDR family oxidoreductase [Pseudomonadota bacterium]
NVYLADIREPGDTARSVQLDVTDLERTKSTLRRLAPDVIIHAAGNKNVRYCEANPEYAYETNSVGTMNVARACRECGARMVYLSTDLVFDCRRGKYREDETPIPGTIYGKTKLQGEKFALEELGDVVICRSGGIYGKGSPLLNWLKGQLEAGKAVDCFTDVFNTPTYAINLAEMIHAVIRKDLKGIFHTVGSQRVNRFELFHSFADVFGLDAGLLVPEAAGEKRSELLLQPDASLSIEYTAEKLGTGFDSLSEGMNRLLDGGGL